jgi:LPS-assembly lipoprotein
MKRRGNLFGEPARVPAQAGTQDRKRWARKLWTPASAGEPKSASRGWLALTPLALLLGLAGCGLHPMYAGGTSGPVASTLARVEVGPIAGKAGWLVANNLRDKLSAMGGGEPLYRLDVTLDDTITGLGVNRQDVTTRERRTLRARFQLVDLAKGTVLLDATAGSDAGIDVVGSEYATIAAENSALENLSETVADKIVERLALYAHRTKPGEAARP